MKTNQISSLFTLFTLKSIVINSILQRQENKNVFTFFFKPFRQWNISLKHFEKRYIYIGSIL